jgi:MerR family transcriptional regulator, light-induced transcriptional regulator
MAEGPRLRIGELSRRVGVSPELLRAWETRYGLLRPERTAGGLRLFSEEDERRVRLMREHIAAGLSASEAARLASLGEDPNAPDDHASLAAIETALAHGMQVLEEPVAQAALDRLFGAYPLPFALSEVILPFLRRLGERWAAGETSVAQEHFASNVIGGRLRALAERWGSGAGPRAVLACPPGERHELGLLCFGLALREHGWRIAYLGAETPLREITDALEELSPNIVVLSAVAPQRFLDAHDELTDLRGRVRVGIGGAGATAELAGDLGVEPLAGDAIGEAARLAPRPGPDG